MTNEPKFTPGPWKQDLYSDCVVVETAERHIATVSNRIDVDCRVEGDLTERAIANAHLIAAAPDMYDLIQEALNQIQKLDFSLSSNWNGAIKTNAALLLQHALDKAEGKR